MKWYKTLEISQKINIRQVFFLATNLQLNDALRLFSFKECMDILYEKLIMEGFNL